MNLLAVPAYGQPESPRFNLEETSVSQLRAALSEDSCAHLDLERLGGVIDSLAAPLPSYLYAKCLALSGDELAALEHYENVVLQDHLDDSLWTAASLDLIRSAYQLNAVDKYRSAGEAYLRLLEIGSTNQEFVEHVVISSRILPDDLSARIDCWPDSRLQTDLVVWWRSQDPLPGSPLNERLVEHLTRWNHAREHFPEPSSLTGLDERGEIYIRFGEPTERKRITLDAIAGRLLRPGVTVNLSDFPESEFWVYRSIDRAANYLFAKKRGRYQISGVTDLVPESLRYGFSPDERGRQKSQMLISVLQEIYRQLAPTHQDFAAMYSEIDNYAEDRGTRSIREQISRDGYQPEPGGALQGATSPEVFAARALVAGQSEDNMRQAYRERVVPDFHSHVLRPADELEISARFVRFLEPDRTTRTEIFWAPYPHSIRLTNTRRRSFERQGYASFDQYLIDWFATRFNTNYIINEHVQDRVIWADVAVIDDTDIPVQHAIVAGDTTLYHIGVQFDQYLLIAGTDSSAAPLKGPPVKVGVIRADSLLPLSADPGTLEMSDLLPHLVSEPERALRTNGQDGSSPYPFLDVQSTAPLALAFEIYNLNFDREDLTRYRITYEIRRTHEKSGLLAPQQSMTTSVSTRYSGSSRNTSEFILIDLGRWPYAGEMEITLHVEDSVSGQHVSRSLPFVLVQSN